MAIDLRSFTPARVGLGRSGHSLLTGDLLRFQLDHAHARDAVHHRLDPGLLGLPHILLHSGAGDRQIYLRRPDLGRKLNVESRALLEHGSYDAAIILADGLSARAVESHARPLLEELLPMLAEEEWRLAPLTVVLEGRVAIGDEIGERLGARLVAVLIGERPGLSSADSLGIYITWDPRVGRTDAERNCISNVRAEGMSYRAAARTLHILMSAARSRKLTGVGLKEDSVARLGSATGNTPAVIP